MRFVQPVVMLLGVVEYVTFFASGLAAEDSGKIVWLPFAIVGFWNLLAFVAFVITIVDSIRKVRARNSRQLATDAMVAKLASIPFFLISWVVLTAFWLGSFGILLFGGPVLWVIIPIIWGLTYLVMLSTSVYGWAVIVQMRRERSIGNVLTVVYTILLFLPVADTVVGVLLFGRRRPRFALVVALHTVGVLLVALGALLALGALPTHVADGIGPVSVAGIIVMIVGFGVVVATGIISVMRRSTLRSEAQRAAVAVESSQKATHPIASVLAEAR